jgi:archaellum biogenesis ATPase FlaH
MRGLKKGSLTVVSGLRGSGKSTVLSQVVLSALSDGFNVICYSGELTDKNFWKWMSLQAAGKGNTVPDKWSGYYKVPDDIDEKIADWMEGHFWLYENDYGNKYSILRRNLERQADKVKADLIILDNLMALNIRDLNPHDKYDAQTSFINDLSSLAKRTNTHIIFVAHPRKAIGFLRLDDISGSADLSNMVDNAFIVHRKNEDFKRLTEQMFKWSEDAEAYKGTNVVEIAKDRDGGTQDVFIPLWYEKESKRLKNSEAEMVAYGWENDFRQVEEDEVIQF